MWNTTYKERPDFKYYKNYGSDEDEDDLMPRAFPMRGGGDFSPEEGPPTSGEEYLKRVRWETKRVPGIVVSNLNPRDFDKHRDPYAKTLPDLPSHPELEASAEWQQVMLQSFGALRKHLEEVKKDPDQHGAQGLRLPPPRDAAAWSRFCFGRTQSSKEAGEEEAVQEEGGEQQGVMQEGQGGQKEEGTGEKEELEEGEEGHEAVSGKQEEVHPLPPPGPEHPPQAPLLHVLNKLDSAGLWHVIQHHIRWLDTEVLTELRSQWLYALLARLDTPLDATIASSLRSLLRRTLELRAQLSGPTDPLLPAHNIIIAIVGTYFGQLEKP